MQPYKTQLQQASGSKTAYNILGLMATYER
jgi:hypothetical protein